MYGTLAGSSEGATSLAGYVNLTPQVAAVIAAAATVAPAFDSLGSIGGHSGYENVFPGAAGNVAVGVYENTRANK